MGISLEIIAIHTQANMYKLALQAEVSIKPHSSLLFWISRQWVKEISTGREFLQNKLLVYRNLIEI